MNESGASSAGGPQLDDHQYTVAGLRSYEAIYGQDFVSPGGGKATAQLLKRVDWQKTKSVLDVGCGLGGAAFMMATEHGADVLGVDASKNMIDAAIKRRDAYGLQSKVTLIHGDISTIELPHQFDLVHSREVFLHIQDKPALFHTLLEALNPGGQLLFTDYCRGPERPDAAFQQYIDDHGYDLRPIEEIADLLEEAGFKDVKATDRTRRFIEIHQGELGELADADLTEPEKDELRHGWLNKIDRARAGEQRWGLFQATR